MGRNFFSEFFTLFFLFVPHRMTRTGRRKLFPPGPSGIICPAPSGNNWPARLTWTRSSTECGRARRWTSWASSRTPRPATTGAPRPSTGPTASSPSASSPHSAAPPETPAATKSLTCKYKKIFNANPPPPTFLYCKIAKKYSPTAKCVLKRKNFHIVRRDCGSCSFLS